MPWDDLYALATPKRSFSMLFNTANVLRRRRSSAGARRQSDGVRSRRLRPAGSTRLDDGAVRERFLADLTRSLPATRGIVQEVVIKRWERGLPYPRVGRAGLQQALTRPLDPIWLAGDYLGTWYTETSVQTAIAAAAAVRSEARRLLTRGPPACQAGESRLDS